MKKLSYDDWCALSQAFWRAGGLGIDQTTRINDFLKSQLAASAPATPPIHFTAGHSRACFKGNIRGGPGAVTGEARRVTCRSCKRTKAFREAVVR